MSGRGGIGRRTLLATATVFPLLFVLHSRIVSSRPYTISEIDIEHDYYYNARRIVFGLPVGSSHHPGTPIYVLSSILLRVSGAAIADTQRFFNVAYWVVAVVSGAVIAYFCLTVLSRVRPWAAVAAFGLLFSWPPLLSYWTYYGADSWSLPVSLLLVSFFWNALWRNNGGLPLLLLIGIMAGTGLAVKMTFLPLVMALVIADLVWLVREGRRNAASPVVVRGRTLWKAAVHLSVLIAGLLGAYLLETLPIIDRLFGVWYGTFHRPDVHPPRGAFVVSVSSTLASLWEWNGILVLGASLAVLAFIVCAVTLTLKQVGRRRREGDTLGSAGDESDEVVVGATFVGVLLTGFCYTLACAVVVTPGAEFGIRLRNSAPCALALPLTVVLVDRAWRWRPPTRPERFFAWTVAIVSVASILSSWMAITEHREALVAKRTSRQKEIWQRFPHRSTETGRLVFWTGAADDHFGEVSFHFWGDYKYGRDHFAPELLATFPGYSFLRLRDMWRRREAIVGNGQEGTGKSRFGKLGDMVWGFRGWLRGTFSGREGAYNPKLELVTGESLGVSPASFLIPESQLFELRGVGLPEFVSALGKRFGSINEKREMIGGESWLILERRVRR